MFASFKRLTRARRIELLIATVLVIYVSYVQFSAGYFSAGRFGNNPLVGVVIHTFVLLAIICREKLIGWFIRNFSHFEELVTRVCVVVCTWFVILYRFGIASGVLPRLYQTLFDPGFTPGSV